MLENLENSGNKEVKVYAFSLYEDSPERNTALKMIRFGLAIPVKYKREIRGLPLVLNPFSNELLGAWYRDHAIQHGVVVVDASWRRLSKYYFRGIRGVHVKLPPLLPGNPVNYGKPCILSSIEAVAAALYILGYKEQYSRLLGLFKWMTTFHTLNDDVLEAYSKAVNLDEMIKVIVEYWGSLDPCYKINILE